MQHKVLAAATALTAAGLVASAGGPWAQIRRPPLPASAAAQTGSSGLPAREAAYGQTAGQGREDTPSTTEAPSSSFGRPNPGRPVFEDPDYRGGEGATGAPPVQSSNGDGSGEGQGGRANGGDDGQDRGQNGGQNGGQATGGNGAQAQGNTGDDDVLQVAEGFFFDNYTSGSGFGVYGGEAVTSGSGEQSNPRPDLPSAGTTFRNLGIQP